MKMHLCLQLTAKQIHSFWGQHCLLLLLEDAATLPMRLRGGV